MQLITVPTFSTQLTADLSVYLLDCIWELFVVVGTKARKARQDIRLALSTAMVRADFSFSHTLFSGNLRSFCH